MKPISLFVVYLTFFMFIFSVPGNSEIPEQAFVPYVDVNITNFDLSVSVNETGTLYYHLAFMLDAGDCSPAWGESIPLDENHMKEEVDLIRSKGGDVKISFGGSLGTELAIGCTTVEDLRNAYQSVIDKYNVKYLDFDIEGSAITDYPSVDRRNKAIAELQNENPELEVSFTIPVLPSGLVDSGLNLLQNAIDNGVRIDLVNIMAMNYGDANAPYPDGYMGAYAIDSAISTIEQMDNMGLSNTPLGITPMIGQNEIESEVFYLTDGDELIEYIESEDRVKLLSMWSTTRDFGSCPGEKTASPVCSGIEQNDYDFTYSFSTLGMSENILPDVNILYPETGQTFTAGESILVEAEAFDADGNIIVVEFYLDSVLAAEDSTAPYSHTIENIDPGTHEIRVLAIDNSGATRTASVNFDVVDANECTVATWDAIEVYTKGDEVAHEGALWTAKWWTQGEEPGTTGEWGVWEYSGECGSGDSTSVFPEVEILNPANGTVLEEGSNVTIEVTATDQDGYIEEVEYFSNSQSIGKVYDQPYEITLYNLSEGEYSFTAVALDDQGNSTVSNPVLLTVEKSANDGGYYCNDYQTWESRTTYYPGDLFEYRSEIYEVLSTAANIKPKRGIAHGYYSVIGECY